MKIIKLLKFDKINYIKIFKGIIVLIKSMK